jgi:hypothetical protein
MFVFDITSARKVSPLGRFRGAQRDLEEPYVFGFVREGRLKIKKPVLPAFIS